LPKLSNIALRLNNEKIMFFAFPKKLLLFAIIGLIGIVAYKNFAIRKTARRTIDFNAEKILMLNDNGFIFNTKTAAQKVGDFLEQNNVILGEHDQIVPDTSTPLYPGTNIEIRRAVKIKIEVDGKITEHYTLQKDLFSAIEESGVKLNPLDIIEPGKNVLPRNNLKAVVTRINVEEKAVEEDINFKTINNEDKALSWREKKITQPGEKGTREVKYRIMYKNGKEVSRVALEKKIIKNPITQIVTQGTYMKLGKAAKGQGTWYAYQGGLFAASTTIPKGNYAKVTNTANGKSIVVQINDYGPQGKGRIIDLDKVAFAKIASIGAGVIGVKVEEVLN